MAHRVLSSCFWLLGLLLSSQLALGQAYRSTYLLFTFEDINNRSPHGTQTYYWLQPLDSVSQGLALRPLFLSGFSQQDERACCQGQAINPYLVTQSSSYDFDQRHFTTLDTLRHLLRTQRRKIQTIHKRWATGQQQTITVYLTPISGVFCTANFLNSGLYTRRLYLPQAKFAGAPSFWQSKASKLTGNWDYSDVPFAVLRPM